MIHKPVLLEPILNFFDKHKLTPQYIVDGTFGRGGHAKAFLDKFSECQIYACDRDNEALAFGRDHFADHLNRHRLRLQKNNFLDIAVKPSSYLEFFNNHPPDLVFLDLGVSSPQLDDPERGFSFYHQGPLDMRMDTEQNLTAFDIINNWGESDLSDLFYQLGEVRFPNKVVRAIVNARKLQPIQTTKELADIIISADGWRKKGKHPATQYFLALRLYVNAELENVERALSLFYDNLADKGLLMVLTFHSTEDRIVKKFMNQLKGQGTHWTKKVIQAERLELTDNPRARSAKLRIFQKGVLGSKFEKKNRKY